MKAHKNYLKLSIIVLTAMTMVALLLRLMLPGEYLFINRLGRTFAWAAFAGLYISMISRSLASSMNTTKSNSKLVNKLQKISQYSLWVALHIAIAHVALMLFRQLGINTLGGLPTSFQYAVGLGFIATTLLLQVVLVQILGHRNQTTKINILGSIAINSISFIVMLHLWLIGQSIQYAPVRSALTLMLIILASTIGFEVSARLSKKSKVLKDYTQFIAVVVAIFVFAFAAGAVNMINNYQPDENGVSSGGHH